MTIEVVPYTHPVCVDLRDARYPDDGVLQLSAAEWAESSPRSSGEISMR